MCCCQLDIGCSAVSHFRLSANHTDEQVMLHFLAIGKHPFCSQYSLISDVCDVMLMMLRRPKFVRILIDQVKINQTIYFND